jgi:chromosome partitioning protein
MILTFAHYKGGTGKTTSCINVAGHLAKQNKKVLVIDLDPQGNATSGLGIDKNSLHANMYDVMAKKKL